MKIELDSRLDMATWIDLASYAAKFGVSQSTLRRRIRARTIPFHLEKGKYYLEDSAETLGRAPLFSRMNVNASLRKEDSLGAHASNEYLRLSEENRQLKNQIAELETFIKALEAEIHTLQQSHGSREFTKSL